MSVAGLNLSETAELYRIGLLAGYYDLPAVVAWSDAALAESPDPPLDLVELSMAANGYVEDTLPFLYALASGGDTEARTHDLLGFLSRRLRRGVAPPHEVAQSVLLVAKESQLSELESFAHGWEDALYPGSTWADRDQVLEHMTSTLSEFAPASGALQHEA